MQPWVWVIIAVAAVLFLLLLFRRGGARPAAGRPYARPWGRPWAPRRRARRYY